MKRDPAPPSSRLVPNSPSRVPSRTPLRRDQPEPSSCVSPPTAAPPSPPATHAPPSSSALRLNPPRSASRPNPPPSATTPLSLLAVAAANRPAPRPLWSSLSRSSLKLSLPSPRRSPPVSSSIDHRILVLLASPPPSVLEAPPDHPLRRSARVPTHLSADW